MTTYFIISQIIKNWWWVFFPIVLLYLYKELYLWWVRWEVWYKTNKWILLEIKPPAEAIKPFKAMEDVIQSVWGIYDGANWRERWYEGEFSAAPYWFSFEITSFGGDIHFYIRILKEWRNTFESAIYSYYPEVEISEVKDYVKNVPFDIPNKEWDLYSEDFSFMKDDAYPIKTYSSFFEEKPDTVVEEKRLDPMYALLEALSKLQSGEQLWFQIVICPVTNKDIPGGWITKGEVIANKLAKRPVDKKSKPMLQGEAESWATSFKSASEHVITGQVPLPQEEPILEEEGLIAPELRLTPGEKDTLKGVENKITKQGFKTWVRVLYAYKFDEPHFFGNYKIIRSYFNHFMSESLNAIVFHGPTRTRIHYLFRDRRLYLRKRKQFQRFIERVPPQFPWNMDGEFPRILDILTLHSYPKGPSKHKGTMVMNAEELATIFHFPPKISVSTVSKVEAKKGGPPSGLPVEENGSQEKLSDEE